MIDTYLTLQVSLISAVILSCAAAGNTIMMSSNHTAFTGVKTDKVKKNSKGGVLITAEEIESAFKMLDADGSGALTLQALKRRLGILFPELSAKEYRFLMNNKKELQLDDLKGLLLDNEVVNFDPVYEAFRTFDVDGSGVMNSTKLREVFVAFGLGELSDSEIDLLMRATDLDGDG